MRCQNPTILGFKLPKCSKETLPKLLFPRRIDLRGKATQALFPADTATCEDDTVTQGLATRTRSNDALACRMLSQRKAAPSLCFSRLVTGRWAPELRT